MPQPKGFFFSKVMLCHLAMESILKTAEKRWKNMLWHSWSTHQSTSALLDSEFIVFPTPAFASSTVLDRPKSHRLGAQSFPPCCQWCTHHTHPTAREATEAEEVKAELGIAVLLKVTLQEVGLLGCQLSQGAPEAILPVPCPFSIPLQSFSSHSAGKPARPSLDTTPSFLIRKAKLL